MKAEPKVLVVDDEETVLDVLQRLLELKGCRVLPAWSAESALQLVEREEPLAALLDIMLPGMDGLKLAGEITQRWPRCKFLMITGHASMETVTEALRRGAVDYLEKPFESLEDVWRKVEHALDLRGN